MNESTTSEMISMADASMTIITTPNIDHYIQSATSANTRKAYQNDIQHFKYSCGVLPATPDGIRKYLHAHAATLNPRTLTRRLTALKQWHVTHGYLDPTAYPLIRKTLTGITRVHGKAKQRAPALTKEQLIMMVTYLAEQNTQASLRNSALLQIGFFGAFRVSELTQIQVEHLHFVPEGLEILIPHSKTDQDRKGQICAIPYGDALLCPATIIKKWCDVARIESGFIFCEVDRYQNIGRKPLNNKSVGTIIKKVATEAGLPEAMQLSTHSLRRGFATTASRKGASFVSIMRHGRWRHERTVLDYIEEGQRFEASCAQLIFDQENKPIEL